MQSDDGKCRSAFSLDSRATARRTVNGERPMGKREGPNPKKKRQAAPNPGRVGGWRLQRSTY